MSTYQRRARQARSQSERPDVTRHRTISANPNNDPRDRQTQIREGLSYGRAADFVDAEQRHKGWPENPGYGALEEHIQQRSPARRQAEQRRSTAERRLSASSRDSDLNQYTRDGSFRPATAKQEHLAQRSPTYGQDHPTRLTVGTNGMMREQTSFPRSERLRGQNLVHPRSQSGSTGGTWRHRKKK